MHNNVPNSTIYAFAKVEAYLEQYAKDHHLPSEQLIPEVAKLLSNGHVLLASTTSAPTSTIKTDVKFDVLGRPRIVHERGKHPYWSKMSKAERSVEMARRIEVRRTKDRERKRLERKQHPTEPMGGVA